MICGKANVSKRVLNDEQLFLHDGVNTKGDIPPSLAQMGSNRYLESLPLRLKDRDQADRRTADLRRDLYDLLQFSA